jgi:nicotinate-nucleotide adenylyltransferase
MIPSAPQGRCLFAGQPKPLAPHLWAGQRIGLLGGSFNPAHEGHRHISLMAMERLGLDWVWWLISPQNPLKSANGMAALEQRLDQARKVVQHPRILVTSLEQELATRYTADSLAKLTQRFASARFVWLMGADNLSQIRHWQRWEEIFSMVPVAVLARAPYSLRALSSLAALRYKGLRVSGSGIRRMTDLGPPVWTFLPIPLNSASATAIRAAQASGSAAGHN